MITIVSYSINQRNLAVYVDYEYEITDEVMGERILRRANATLSQKVVPLDAPDWSDADLCAALATAINQDPASVVMAEEAPPIIVPE